MDKLFDINLYNGHTQDEYGICCCLFIFWARYNNNKYNCYFMYTRNKNINWTHPKVYTYIYQTIVVHNHRQEWMGLCDYTV
jgi:hypothetical protein